MKSFDVEINLSKNAIAKGILLREYLPKGQHINSFEVEGFDGKNWNSMAKGSTIGNRRILTFNPTNIQKLRIKTAGFDVPGLSEIEVY